ncbi:MAG TPA: hypothetical protein VFF69_11440 [Phycisphaerales bacterium]|nr:hypothetical protein [Phycisphaerales bacterium]
MPTILLLNIVGLTLNMAGAALLALDPIYGAGARFQTTVRGTQLDNEARLHEMIVRGIRASPSPPHEPAEIQALADEEAARHAGAVASIEKKFKLWTGHESRVVNFAALGVLALMAGFALQLIALIADAV